MGKGLFQNAVQFGRILNRPGFDSKGGRNSRVIGSVDIAVLEPLTKPRLLPCLAPSKHRV